MRHRSWAILLFCLVFISLFGGSIFRLVLLQKSFATWSDAKNMHQSSYQYTSSTVSFTGYRTVTTFIIHNDVVVERDYKSFTGNGDSKKLYDSWQETEEAELGTHQEGAAIWTIDEIYNECKVSILPRLPIRNRIYLELDNNGILSSCVYVPRNCADDCARGVSIDSITFSDTKVYGALP